MNVTLQATPLAPLPNLDWEDLIATRDFPILSELRPAFVAHGAGRENLERLFSGGALCVTTGQQPGLCTGPLYTIYKGLSTVALARVAERELARPVVPVYWVAGDDHDLAEANHIYLPTLDNQVDRIVLRERAAEDALVPLYREPLGDEVSAVLEAIVTHTPETEFRPEILRWLSRHYVPERDFATAFGGALAELLGDYGLVVFHGAHEAAKRAAAPLLVAALDAAVALDEALAAQADTLAATGRPVPVAVGNRATTVMVEDRLGRDRLVLGDDARFVARRTGESWSLEDLHRLAGRQPQRLSPNVLLRPVMEAALLPTALYVAGPGELDYLSQCEPLYAALGVSPQGVAPRWSGRVIEARVQKVLDKYDLAPDDFDGPEGHLEGELVRHEMPADVQEALTALERAVSTEYARLEAAMAEIDPTLKMTVQTTRNSAFAGLTELEKKVISHLKKHNEVVVQQLAKVRHNLFPAGRPQERVFNVAPYLIRYGRAFLDAVLQQASTWYAQLERARPEP